MAQVGSQRRRATPFAEQLLDSDNPLEFCVAMLLAWLTAIDGTVTGDERSFLHSAPTSATGGRGSVDHALRFAIDGNLNDVQLASEVVRGLDEEDAKLFLELAVGVALADGHVGHAELHALIYFADLCGFTLDDLNSVFMESTGKRFPTPGDPSTLAWWKTRDDRRAKKSRDSKCNSGSHGKSNGNDPQSAPVRESQSDTASGPTWAYAILGLEASATTSDVQTAFLRLSRVHHPDKFHALGDEAVRTATEIYKRIVSAYEAFGQP